MPKRTLLQGLLLAECALVELRRHLLLVVARLERLLLHLHSVLAIGAIGSHTLRFRWWRLVGRVLLRHERLGRSRVFPLLLLVS
jgi:hypothetical protein